MARDYYKDAREIAARLVQDGLSEEARSLLDAIEGGATATEILMALRWHLEHIDRSDPATSQETRRRIRDLSKALHTALGQ